MLGLSVLPAVLQFVGFLFLPESPRWLIQRGLTQKARRVLSQIRGNQNIDEEYDSIKNSLDEEDSGGGTEKKKDWGEGGKFCCFFNLFLLCCLHLYYKSTFTGIHAVGGNLLFDLIEYQCRKNRLNTD